MDGLKWRLTEFLDKIKSDRDFRKILLDNAESIIEDVYTFGESGCGKCKKHILRYADENVDIINKVIDEYSKLNISKEETTVVQPQQPHRPTRVIGDIFEIDANPEAYKQFITEAQQKRWMHRGLTVVPKDNKWIIFFY